MATPHTSADPANADYRAGASTPPIHYPHTYTLPIHSPIHYPHPPLLIEQQHWTTLYITHTPLCIALNGIGQHETFPHVDVSPTKVCTATAFEWTVCMVGWWLENCMVVGWWLEQAVSLVWYFLTTSPSVGYDDVKQPQQEDLIFGFTSSTVEP